MQGLEDLYKSENNFCNSNKGINLSFITCALFFDYEAFIFSFYSSYFCFSRISIDNIWNLNSFVIYRAWTKLFM